MKKNPFKFAIKLLFSDQGDQKQQAAAINDFLKSRSEEFGRFREYQVVDKAVYSSDSPMANSKLAKLLESAKAGVEAHIDPAAPFTRPTKPLQRLLPGSIIIVAKKGIAREKRN